MCLCTSNILCSCLGQNHQVCAPLTLEPKGKKYEVMDSLAMRVPINRSMILQMAQVYQVPNNHSTFSVKVLLVQQLNGHIENGYRDSFTTEICRGQDPSRAVFIQTQMWGHLFRCLARCLSHSFHSKKRQHCLST